MVKGHVASITSLSKHTIEVVLAASREVPEMQKGLNKGLKSHMEQFTTAMILHSSIPPKFSISVEPLVHDTIQTFDEIVEVFDLLCLVLVALQSLVILPKWGRS